MKRTIIVQNKKVGSDEPCFIVAEAGVNHNGNFDLAKKLIDQAKAVGADAVKFQTFIPEEVAVKDAAKGNYQKESTGEEENQYEMIKKLFLSEGDFGKLQDYAEEVGIIFYSTPHDLSSVDIIDRLDLPVIKIASPDLNNGLMFYKIANNPRLKYKPLFLSTGGATMQDVKDSLSFLKDHGFEGPILVYHCTSSYPTPTEEQNLKVLETMRAELGEAFDVVIGFSDNGNQIEVDVDAVILGAVSIEKHMTLDKSMVGPDHKASLNGEEFARMVKDIRDYEASVDKTIRNPNDLGDGIKKVQPSEANNIDIFRKAVRARSDLKAGIALTFDLLNVKRTKGTFNPLQFEQLLGKILKQDVAVDTEITPRMVQ